MAKRQREWARQTRDKLFDLLGRYCAKCSTDQKLEFDVIIPTGDDKHHRVMEWSWRMSFYRAQYDRGNLQVLCDRCNTRKSNQMELNPNLIDCPF